jgi:lipid-A-disaccharide synthase-like uncharacterized protein
MNIGESISAWRVLGFAGSALFAARWLVQLYASRQARRPVITPAFWAMSVGGSLLLLSYFTFGPNRDPVGIVSNLLPLSVSAYNVLLVLERRRSAGS